MSKKNKSSGINRVFKDELITITLVIIIFVVLSLALFVFEHIRVHYYLVFVLLAILLLFLYESIRQNRDLFLETERRSFLNRIYIEILKTFAGITSYEELFGRIVNVLVDNEIIFSASGYLYETEENQVVVKYTLCKGEGFGKNTTIPLGEFAGRYCIENNRLYIVTVEEPPRICSFVSAEMEIKRFFSYFFPISYEEEVVGILECLSTQRIEEEVILLMEKIAVQLGIAIMYLRRNKQVHELKSELEEKNKILIAQNKELQAQSEELEAQTEELRAQKVELEEANKKLKKLESYKSEFLANMAHELRTPLNSIIGLSQLILKDPIPDASLKQKIDVIYTSGKQLLNIINDILDLSKIEAGKLEVTPEEFNLTEVLEYVETIISSQCEKKGLELTIENTLSNDMLYTDRHKVIQILLNLLSNAIKYTDRGKITIRAYEIEKDKIRLDVCDTGIGIKKELIEDIFEPFHRIETKKYIQGTGLGLPLTKKLITLLGGSILVKSKLKQGTTFSIVLPRRFQEKSYPEGTEEKKKAPGTQARGEVLPSYPARAEAREPTVMVVDDDLLSIKELTSFIREIDPRINILTAKNGKEALEQLKEHPVDIIFLDLDMPEMDGYEFMHKLRTKGKDAKIVVVTAMDIDEKILDEYGEFVKSIFIKGRDTKYYLKSIIKKLLGETEEEMEDVEEIEERMREIEKGPQREVDGGKKRILLVEDNLANRFLIRELLAEYDVEMDEAGNGLEALDLLGKKEYDLILMDIQMPKMDGYEALDHIKSNKKLRHIPVIALTAKAFKRDIEQMKEMGFYEVILKPINMDSFHEIIKRFLSKK